MKEELREVAEALQHAEHADSIGGSWAKVTKHRRKVKKNLLLVRVSEQAQKTTELKSEVFQALQGIQVMCIGRLGKIETLLNRN